MVIKIINNLAIYKSSPMFFNNYFSKKKKKKKKKKKIKKKKKFFLLLKKKNINKKKKKKKKKKKNVTVYTYFFFFLKENIPYPAVFKTKRLSIILQITRESIKFKFLLITSLLWGATNNRSQIMLHDTQS